MDFECPGRGAMGPDGSPGLHDARRRTWLVRSLASAVAAMAGYDPTVAFAHELVEGQPAPALTLHALDGRTLSTTSLLGKVIILTFWATWCEPCRDELPLLSAFAARHAADGLVVLGFSLDGPDTLAEVQKVARTLSFPVGLLPTPWAGGYGRIWRLPVSFAIDRGGRLAHNGWNDDPPAWNADRLQRVVVPLLQQNS